MSESLENPYERVPYPAYTHHYSHPDRLATIAAIHGLTPPNPSRCSILELGCGSGANLIPIAYSHPKNFCLGIDLAQPPIALARQMASDLALTNTRFQCADILDLDSSLGSFDFILVHGVFSWVPQAVRLKILELCRTLLSPNGLAFISYNAFPGAHLRVMMRQMMLFHTQSESNPLLQAQKSAELLRVLATTHSRENNPINLTLHAEAERLLKAEPSYLYHDDLAEWNQPYYFAQFMDLAQNAGLQFVAESDYIEMQNSYWPENALELIRNNAANRIAREQYYDFLRNRQFRQTILTHREAPVSETPVPNGIATLLASSQARLLSNKLDLNPDVRVTFESPRGPKFESQSPTTKALIAVLTQAFPNALPESEQLSRIRHLLAESHINPDSVANDLDPAILRPLRIELYSLGILDLYHSPPSFGATTRSQPRLSPIVQWQLQRGNYVTTLRHEMLKIESEGSLPLLQLLDGTRNLEMLLADFTQLCRSHPMGISPNAAPTEFQAFLHQRLEQISSQGLLL